jgi:hypothetical protein
MSNGNRADTHTGLQVVVVNQSLKSSFLSAGNVERISPHLSAIKSMSIYVRMHAIVALFFYTAADFNGKEI